MSNVIILATLLIVIQMVMKFKIDESAAGSETIVSLPSITESKQAELTEINSLQHKLNRAEGSNEKVIEQLLQEKAFERRLKNERHWNFNHTAIPSLLISREQKVIDANSAFYMAFNNSIPLNIRGFALDKIAGAFDENFEYLLDKINFVIETGEFSYSDLIETKGVLHTLFRVYVSRVKYDNKEILMLQFIKFPVMPKMALTIDKTVNLGILQFSNHPSFISDSSFNIVDKNEAAIQYFKSLDHNISDKKLYQIYPAIKNLTVLEGLTDGVRVDLDTLGSSSKTQAFVSKLQCGSETFFLFTLV